MTTLTDAVARAIKLTCVQTLPNPCVCRNAEPFARAAITEFCRYLRETNTEMVNKLEPHDSNQSRRAIREVLHALATHIEGENTIDSK